MNRSTIEIGSHVHDPDGDIVFFACCDGVRGGSASTDVSAGGQLTVTFTPDSGFSGSAGFSFRVDDQHGHVVSAPVTVDVLAPANRPPVATDGTANVEAGTTGSVSLRPFVSDPDEATGDTLTFAVGAHRLGRRPRRFDRVVSTPIDAGGRTISVPFIVTDSAGAQASGDAHRDGHAEPVAAADRRARRGAHDPDDEHHRRRAVERRRPARAGAARDLGGRSGRFGVRVASTPTARCR